MKTINKVMLLGNLATDVFIRETKSGKCLGRFVVATDYKTSGENGEMKKNTNFHRVVVWQKLAQICAKYLKKGSKIFLMGRIQTRSFQDQEGKKKFDTEIVASDVNILSWIKDNMVQENESVSKIASNIS